MLGRYLDLGKPVAHDHPLNQGLVAWWLPLPNNQGGSRLFDIAGRFDGTLTNGPTWGTGPNGFASTVFDGTDDYVSPGNLGLSGATARTFAGWFRPTTISSGPKALFFAGPDLSTPLQSFSLFSSLNTNGDLYVLFTGRDWYTATNATAVNVWTHVAVTYNGGAVQTAGSVVVYVNGVSQSISSTGSSTGNANTVETDFALGTCRALNSLFLIGALADCRFHNRALAADEIVNLYDQSCRGHPDTLRRWTPRAWVFGGTAAGGTTTQNLAGSSTAAGSLVRAVSKALAGSTTPAGSPALLAAKPLAGSTTAAGTLAMLAAKPLAGSITAAGPLANATAKPLAGSSTATGDLTTVRAVLQSVGGSATPAGTVARAAAQAIAGTTTPVGSAANAVSKPLAGSITPTGIVAKQANLLIAGSTTPAGSLVRTVAQAVAAAVTAVGSLARAVAKALAGAVTGSGALARVGGSEPISVVTPGGTVRRRGNLARVIRRLPANVPRLVRRPSLGVPASRVIRGARPMPTAGEFPTESRVKGAAETVEYLFDFTPFPEIVAGETISSVSVPAVSGLTIGSPAVTAALTDGVAAGKGVEVAISGGTAGTTYAVSCRATMSGGAIREIRLSLTVR